MRHFISFSLMLCAISALSSVAFAGDPRIIRAKPMLTGANTSFSMGFGLRQNSFDFNIASDLSGESTPNIISELTWDDIMLLEGEGVLRHEVAVDSGYIPKGKLVVEGAASLGMTFEGDNQDSDYFGDDRTLEFSRSNNNADEGFAMGASAAVGYKFFLTNPGTYKRVKRRPSRYNKNSRAGSSYRKSNVAVTLTPLIGYGWDQQTYKMTDGFQTIPDLGAFAGLDSEYQTNWYGPFLGIEAEIYSNRHKVTLRGEYHSLDYHGEGIWNLRDDFMQDPSFKQEGTDASGIKLDAEYSFALDSRYEFVLNGIYESRKVEDGLTSFYRSNGSVGAQRMNEANDESISGRAGLRYNW